MDTPDSHGGDIRTITALDISDTTAVASDVAQGKYFYTADGTKTAGSREEIIDGDNLEYGGSQDRTSPIVGTGQAGYAVI